MSVDPAVIAALEAAVAAAPDQPGVRLHLAGLLLDADKAAQALDHVSEVLRQRPDDVAALQLAAACAAATGEDERAARYRRLAAALGTEPVQRPAPRPLDVEGLVPDTVDELVNSWHDSAPAHEPEHGSISRPVLSLSDVGGMSAVKRRLQLSFLAPLQNPDVRLQFGKSLRGGLLLWGPPGCGKTFIARALAGELGASFYEIALNDILDMWVGSSERNLHSVFDVARAHSPCLLFFDEIDALGHKRSNLRAGGVAMRGVVNQLLVELDGASGDNEGVFVLAATNHPWDVDPALLRPGRLDRSLFVEPPDRAARQAILDLHLKGKPTERLDTARIARTTKGMSGADLALICDQATERALEASIESGAVRPITQPDLDVAAQSVRSSIAGWMDAAKNYVRYGNSAGSYDELADYLTSKTD